MEKAGFFDRFRLSSRTTPWFLAGISILAFGLLMPWLGLYQDDWHHIYYYAQIGVNGLRRFLYFDSRPFAFIVYEPLFRALSVQSLRWHVYLLVVRLFVVLAFLGILNLIWPDFRKANMLVAALFMVYPVFLLQPMSAMFALHWSMYLFYMLSILMMLMALRRPHWFVPFTFASVFLQMVHLLMLEYFVGLEFFRPVLLFFVIEEKSLGKRFLRTLKAWGPYLLVLAAYIPFRISFGQLFDYERNIPTVFLGLFTKPLETLGYLLQVGFQDIVATLFSPWYSSLQPDQFDFSQSSNIYLLILTLVCTFVCYIYFSRVDVHDSETNQQKAWAKPMIGFGMLATICGLLPGWAVGKTLFLSNQLWSGRLAMASMFGASMVWAGAIYLMVRSQAHRYFLFSVLIALAIGLNLRTALSYKASWEKQLLFYWQLYWRAPYIQPHTAFVSDSEFLFYMGVYPTSFAINTLYPQTLPTNEVGYWLYASGEHIGKWSTFRAGAPLKFHKYASMFDGISTDSLALDFRPGESQCLRILRPEDKVNPSLPAMDYEFLPVSNLDRIRESAPIAWSPPEAIFGHEPPHDWCYYFEKADLARQYRHWDQIPRLWSEAAAKGLSPDNGDEMAPFVEAYARTDDWKMATWLTISANRITEHTPRVLCPLWQNLIDSTTDSSQRETAVSEVENKLYCGFASP